jgi:hypothetical protein
VFGRRRSPEKQHERDVSHAEFHVELAEMKHRSAVKEAQRTFDKVDKPLLTLERTRDLFGPSLRVYGDRVETPSGTRPLARDLSARVEGSGRSLVVLVESCADGWGHTQDPHPDDTVKAHDFAREFNALVRRLPVAEPDPVAQARAELERVTADRSATEAAQAEPERLRSKRPGYAPH